jgi:ABC-type Fe3+/spermidine/putrescine transport system ATPase subunit
VIYDAPATPFVADFIGDMNHLEGTLQRDGDQLVVDVAGARLGVGRVVRDAPVGTRVRVGLRPEEVHANTRGEGSPATARTAMVLGHHLQVVARLDGGAEMLARQRRAGDEGLTGLAPGDRLWLGWSPAAAMLLGPVDGASPARVDEPLELQA